MIEIEADLACLLYLGGALLVISGVWLIGRHSSKSRDETLLPLRRWVCEFCHHSYLEEISHTISRCPQCRFLNERPGDSKETPKLFR